MPATGVERQLSSTTESATCPVCASEGQPRYVQQDFFCAVPGEFGQRFCSRCELFFLSPRVKESEIGPYYPESYVPYREQGRSLALRIAEFMGLPFRRRRMVEEFVRGGKLLDVGCGNGTFLRSLLAPRDGASQAQWELHAMDLSYYGGADFPAHFYQGQFDHERPPVNNLDAITLWHVFEHLYHPRKALQHAAAILRPGGFLFLAIPDLRSLEPKIFGKYWIGWDAPRHVTTYSKKGLEQLLNEAGFRLVDDVADVCTGEMLLLNVDFYLRSRGIRSNLHTSMLGRSLLSPLIYVLVHLGLAPAKVYVAQR